MKSKTVQKLLLIIRCITFLPAIIKKKLFKPKTIYCNLVIFDMDGTFTTTHTFKQALTNLYKDNGETYEKVIFTQNNKKGFTVDNQRMLDGLKYLTDGQFKIDDEKSLEEKAIKNVSPAIKKMLKKIPVNVETIIITKSSDHIAKKLAKRFGLSNGYGSIMEYDKKRILKTARLLVTDNVPNLKTKIKLVTKETLARKHMEKKRMVFDLNKTIFVGNDALDLELMVKCVFSILVKKEKSEFIDSLVYYLTPYDFILSESSNSFNSLEKILNTKIRF